jgi:hypothetical protein
MFGRFSPLYSRNPMVVVDFNKAQNYEEMRKNQAEIT